MAPPQLTRNTPIAYVLNPIQISSLETVRYKVNPVTILLRMDCSFSEWLHLHEPLCGQVRFNNSSRAFTVSNLMHMIFNIDQHTLFLQVSSDGLTAYTPVLTLVRSSFFIHRTALIHYIDLRQVMALAHLEVIRVMSRCNLNRTTTKLFIYILISDNWDLTADNRQDQRFADHIFITIIFRMNSNRCIA
ncbi:hypothetical protein D3C76_377450 [compost metagenome]